MPAVSTHKDYWIRREVPRSGTTPINIIKSMGNPATLEKLDLAARVPATCPIEVLTKTEAFRRRRNLEPKSYF
jgi:hypothetical protein